MESHTDRDHKKVKEVQHEPFLPGAATSSETNEPTDTSQWTRIQ